MNHEVAEQDVSTLNDMNGQGCGVLPLQFVQVEDYATFRAEYAVEDDDIILHFFRSPELKEDQTYWLSIFPAALDPVARDHFQATMPRLRAEFVGEMDSWWLRANKYGNILQKDAYIRRFLTKLDQTLKTMISR